ncbi:MAG: LamG domain-containing protein, partial [Sedimentisphaerales bacterium]|nr:LamG domain-containing protein [Sedimentisphaerales bacterium]
MRLKDRCAWACLAVLVLSGIAWGFNPDADSSLVGCWKLDETEGTIAHDSSKYENHGTVMGNPKWAPGKMKGCLDMDGDGDYVDCGNPSLFNFGDVITVALWLNIRAVNGQWMAAVAKGESAWRISLYDTNRRFHFAVRGGPNYEAVNGNITVGLNEWHHVTGTYDGAEMRLYVDGVLDNTAALTGGMHTAGGNLLIGDNPQATGRYWNGMIDDVRIYHRALSEDEIKVIVRGIWDPVADKPVPRDGASDVPRDVVLSWTAGPYAKTHDVYFGADFDDVNTASREDPKGVLLSKDQQQTTFDPPGLLSYGQTYYWRVDEVNGPPDYKIYKGIVWSFTAEPYSYPVKPIAATASSIYKAAPPEASTGPERTIDGSGLVGDAHSTRTADMWISKLNIQPIWIQYEFDKVYKLDQLWVWNSNQVIETMAGYGAKDVEIVYSEDGQTWN